MVTPKFKLPEMIAGSLQMSAYNDRLAFIDTLVSEIEITEVIDQQNPAGMQNSKIQAISSNPTQVSTNWYKDKASQLHLQVDGMIKYLSGLQNLWIKVRYKNAKRADEFYTIADDSYQAITYSSSTSTTTITAPSKCNIIVGATVNNYLVLKADPLIRGMIYVVNSSSNTTNICLNDSLANGGFCSIISPNQTRQFLVDSGTLSLLV